MRRRMPRTLVEQRIGREPAIGAILADRNKNRAREAWFDVRYGNEEDRWWGAQARLWAAETGAAQTGASSSGSTWVAARGQQWCAETGAGTTGGTGETGNAEWAGDTGDASGEGESPPGPTSGSTSVKKNDRKGK